MQRLAIFLIGIVLSSGVSAHEWTDAEKVVLGASTAALLLDWGQTRRAAERQVMRDTWQGDVAFVKWHETNHLLGHGQTPSAGKINNYFAAAMIGNYLVADHLDEHRMTWLLGVTLLEVAVIIRNRMLGISWGF